MWECKCALGRMLPYAHMGLVLFARRVMLVYVHTPLYTHVFRRILQYTKRGMLHFARLRIC